jgi:hypothetical protein
VLAEGLRGTGAMETESRGMGDRFHTITLSRQRRYTVSILLTKKGSSHSGLAPM